ncbi:MAG: hypothetical protein CBR30_09655 [Dictyoglomus sp. NZ13-RE01]|nr:MAG: hypothetical protein CBR30_09655 [Dictyoglomus sp. NZ13-RE01]
MEIYVTAITDKGCIREQNEDRILVCDEILQDGRRDLNISISNNDKFFIAIADGMGGHAAGEIAAEMTLDLMRNRISFLEIDLTDFELKKRIQEIVQEVHNIIIEESNKNPERSGMGTTLIGLLFYKEFIYYLNIGDSRLYRFRDDLLVQISKDHSLKALTGIQSHIILNCVGGKNDTVFVEFDQVSKKIFEGDILILCSDGLTDMVPDEEIESILKSSNDPAFELVSRAKQNGGIDNISVVTIQILNI